MNEARSHEYTHPSYCRCNELIPTLRTTSPENRTDCFYFLRDLTHRARTRDHSLCAEWVRPLSLRGPRLDPLRSSGRLPRPRYLTWRGCSGFLRTVGLFSCPSSSRRIFLEFYILSSEVEFVVLRPSTSVLFQDGLGHRQTRATVQTPAGSRSRLWLLVSRPVSDIVS